MYIVTTSKLEFRSLSHILGLATTVPIGLYLDCSYDIQLKGTKFDYEKKFQEEK